MVNHRERGGIQMHLLRLLTLAAFLVSGSVAVATPLWVDLGPTGVVHNSRTVDSGAPNVQFAGQNIDIDFSFQNGQVYSPIHRNEQLVSNRCVLQDKQCSVTGAELRR